MAYATGIVANPAALQTVIENFATTNGWTLNAGAGSWLSKGGSAVKFTSKVPKASTNTWNVNGTTVTVTDTAHGLTTGTLIKTMCATLDGVNVDSASITVTGVNAFTFTIGTSYPAQAVNPATGADLLYFIISVNSTEVLTIQGAMSSIGATPDPFPRSLYIPVGSWPINYYIFSNSSPDMITCVLQYDVDKIEIMYFGDMVKLYNSAYVGGNFTFARYRPKLATSAAASVKLYSLTDTVLNSSNALSIGNNGQYSAIPYTDNASTGIAPCNTFIAIDSTNWGVGNDSSKVVALTDYTISLLFRSPNSWNQQANLIPIHLNLKTTASTPYYHDIGYIEHLRFIRVDNYALGDEITIGSDIWKVFPWIRKNATWRNGGDGTVGAPHSGTVGFAVRKT